MDDNGYISQIKLEWGWISRKIFVTNHKSMAVQEFLGIFQKEKKNWLLNRWRNILFSIDVSNSLLKYLSNTVVLPESQKKSMWKLSNCKFNSLALSHKCVCVCAYEPYVRTFPALDVAVRCACGSGACGLRAKGSLSTRLTDSAICDYHLSPVCTCVRECAPDTATVFHCQRPGGGGSML